jgi:hypothetical protein
MKRFREAMQFFYTKHFGGSFVFDVFMRIGAFLFALLKKNQQLQIVYDIDGYVLFSSDENLRIKLEKQQRKKVVRASEIKENSVISQGELKVSRWEMLLDNNSFTFKEIITFLEENKNNGYTFKIIPEKVSFMIGSNSSNDRGEVIEIRN